MTNCCVCQFTVRNPRNIFKESIGKPPMLICDLVLRCTRGTGFEIPKKSSICKKCTEKLLRYYKSVEIAKQTRQEILDLIRSPMIIEEFKASLTRSDIKVEDESTVTEFLIEVEKDEPAETKEEEEEEDSVAGEVKDEYQLIEVDEIGNEIVVEEQLLDEELVKYDGENNVIDISYEEEHLATSDMEDYDCNEELQEEEEADLETSNPGEIKCPECDLVFSSRRKFNAHTKRDHFPGYVCDQCGKTLHSYSGFIGHLQNHEPVKQFECPDCGERFNRKFRLKHHMAWHSGEMPFQCDVCSKRFVHKVALYKHKQIHDDDTKRLECHVCGFKFRTKAHLERHMRSHTGAKPFTCPVCKKRFSQMYNMKAHLREHENPGCNRQRRFRCSKCSHSFINEQHFQEHCERDDCDSKS